jgi:hypothetical protein
MKTLLAAAIAIGVLAGVTADAAPFSAQGLPMSSLPTPTHWECGLIQVSPPDRDRDPGMKINISTDADNFYVTHTMISGAQYERTEQYGVARVWTDANFNWLGRSYKNPAIVMIGTLGRTGLPATCSMWSAFTKIGSKPRWLALATLMAIQLESA